LPNFRSFHARLEEEVARADRYAHPLSCAMVDLDGLKEINDRLGHGAGNRAILGLADAVREELRDTDFAARYGGDEFVVLLPQTTAAAAALFAERLRRRLLEVSQARACRCVRRSAWRPCLPTRWARTTQPRTCSAAPTRRSTRRSVPAATGWKWRTCTTDALAADWSAAAHSAAPR